MAQSSRQPSGNVASPSTALDDSRSPLVAQDSRVVDDMGKLSLNDSRAVYTGSSHWATILEDIQHLKDELSEEHSDYTASFRSTLPDAGVMHGSPAARISLLNSAPRLPREQILAMIPPRKMVDRHVSQFFNGFDMAPFVLHRNEFLAEYADFWDNPSATPIMWVGLLFSVMSASALLQQQDASTLDLSAAESQDMLNGYRTLTIQCLVAGDYLRSSRYTMETLILHFGVDQSVNVDASTTDSWILIGVIIRIALRMGLHRDPSHWPHIRPLQAELRRRLWITLYQMDFFTSTQVGLPRIIKDSQCDTRPPAHLLDHDIGFEHDDIPPERPLTEPTPLLYIVQRNAIIKVAAEIYDATEAGPASPATSAALNAKLERAVDAIPACLKYTSLETSLADSPITVLHQMILDILIHKAIYLLHRRSFVKGAAGEESAKSNDLCIEAALVILRHQQRMGEETQPGGLMFGIRWKVASSLNHEFLQATMILCLVLGRFNEGHVGIANSSALHRRGDILEALTIVRNLWEKIADRSLEAQKAANAIATVLQQDLNRPGAPTSEAPGGFLDQMAGVTAEEYFGDFDYGQDLALDPSLFAIGDYAAASGSMSDDFVTE